MCITMLGDIFSLTYLLFQILLYTIERLRIKFLMLNIMLRLIKMSYFMKSNATKMIFTNFWNAYEQLTHHEGYLHK